MLSGVFIPPANQFLCRRDLLQCHLLENLFSPFSPPRNPLWNGPPIKRTILPAPHLRAVTIVFSVKSSVHSVHFYFPNACSIFIFFLPITIPSFTSQIIIYVGTFAGARPEDLYPHSSFCPASTLLFLQVVLHCAHIDSLTFAMCPPHTPVPP